MMNTTTLYRKDSNGNVRTWAIGLADGGEGYTTESGILNTTKIIRKSHIVEPKAGRTMVDQIDLEIKSQISSKIRHGYVLNLGDCLIDRKLNGLGYPRPMLAKAKVPMGSFTKRHLVQRKYNGLRFLVIMTAEDGLQAYSKSGIKYDLPQHIEQELWDKMDDIPNGIVFDGEIYLHGLPLQTINSWVKKPCEETSKLNYVIYDVIKSGTYFERKSYLDKYFDTTGGSVILADTVPYDSNKIKELMALSLKQGYEGLIIREGGADYNSGGRSKVMCKIKQFETMEVEIISTKKSKLGFAIHTCRVFDDKTVDVLHCGSHEEKRAVYNSRDEFVGKVIEISYSEMSIGEIPQQPQMLHIREWD